MLRGPPNDDCGIATNNFSRVLEQTDTEQQSSKIEVSFHTAEWSLEPFKKGTHDFEKYPKHP